MNTEPYGNYAPSLEYYVHRISTPNWEIIENRNDFIDLTFIQNGNALYWINQKKYRVSAGDLLCIPQGSLRSAVNDPGSMMESYALNIRLFTHTGKQATLPFPLITHIGHHPDLITLYNDLNAEWLNRAPGYRMKVNACILLILHRYFEIIVFKEDPHRIDPRIRNSIRYITDHFSEPITIQELADYIGLNPVYFGSLFKESTGMSFRKYLNYIRLNNAEEMLRSGEYNVNKIAARCGFSDVFYFSKVFKARTGFPPSQMYKSK